MSQASKQQEKTFTGKVGFVLASVGAAIGLGAIWKFPCMAGAEGGAAFLLPYIIFSFTLAFGLLLTEITLGKAGKGGIVTAYRNLGGSFWSVLGYLGIIIGFVVLSFYSVVGGWCLLYFFHRVPRRQPGNPRRTVRKPVFLALGCHFRSDRLPCLSRICGCLRYSRRHRIMFQDPYADAVYLHDHSDHHRSDAARRHEGCGIPFPA